MAEEHWRKHRPKLVKKLEAEGTLYDHLKEAEDNALDMMEDLWKKGVDAHAQREIALHEFILLSDQE
jgi:hypothetical protein